ncbi:HAMP domain-containing histidine kinase [Paenibacillus sp. IB182496]|uniref:histidine kinase n=1 Tax=Paenibacillus sabuli TaxID=2772509 RepID=A0A927BR42_9BACL|nr:HAMP domain-containing sensor histidine kinase [Paenibacillus sabuli]MBD2844220.1 HAMP domain-containing histidine kinase [Paenibacillus sabuli]
MRISIKLKFSAFLAVLLLLTVFILSVLVLQGIQTNQRTQMERSLAQQARTANLFFVQTLLTESIKVPRTYLAENGASLASQLKNLSGLRVALYDQDGNRISPREGGPAADPARLQTALRYALDNQTAYLTRADSLYYLAPLRSGGAQIGVVQFHYPLADHAAFADQIRQLFVSIGAVVFVLSFVLAYFYFDGFANRIIRLNGAVDRIRSGRYDTALRTRKDEIGELAEGIRAMSEQIRLTLRAKDEEREKLALAVDKLSRLDEQQKQFIGNVTHEFKTPLTSIKSYLDLLDMYPDDEQLLGKAIGNIAGETQRLYEMVEKVLQLSALEKYDFEYHKERINIREAVLAVLNSLRGKIEKFGIRLDTELADAEVEADRDCLTIVLMNLMDNAIKYNRPGGRIAVTGTLKDGTAALEIADNGIGIPEDVASRIFDPFYTVDKNRARENGGAGLGLSLAKRYTESQGGTIALARTGPEGTAFTVAFPAANRAESDEN